MPLYIYRCENAHETEIIEPMLDTTEHVCIDCGSVMHRRPQAPAITWGGLKPSQGELSPAIKRHIDEAPRRRDHEIPHRPGYREEYYK